MAEPESPLDRPSPRSAGESAAFGAVVRVSQSGPLPSAEQLAAYEDRFPGFGERIMAMAEKSVTHELAQEESQAQLQREVLRSDQKRSFLGLWLGSLIILTTIIGGIAAIFNGHDTAGASIIAAVVGALAYVFSTTLNQGRRKEK